MNATLALLLVLGMFPQAPPEIVASGKSRIYLSDKMRFTYASDGLTFVLGERRRHVDLNQLPVHANDCFSDQCPAQPRAFCEACIKSFDWIAWDEHRQRAFFVIATDTSQNRPWILADYDFKTNKVTRFGEFYGGGIAGEAIVSPSGRYLAMKGAGVCGGCCSSTYLMVADLVEHRIGTKQLPSEQSSRIKLVESFHWAGESEIVYDEQSYDEKECRAGGNFEKKQSTLRIKLSEIDFPK